MPQGSSYIWFEGVKTTPRARDMLIEARKIFTRRTGKKPPRISQGGFNAGGVTASAGTHDRAAFDFATSGWSTTLHKAWEDALWEVGFAAWHRTRIPGLWPEHTHAIPKGDDLSRGAAAQVRAFQNRRDGLVGNRPYTRIGKWAMQTWEKYRAAHREIKINGKIYPDISSVSVLYINDNRKSGAFSRNIWYVQTWLRKIGRYKGPLDGKWNKDVQAGLDAFRKSLGWSAADSTGAIGITSLTKLRDKAGSKKKLKVGK